MKNKNIFILPTTEPSQVYLVKSTNALGFTSGDPELCPETCVHNTDIE